jgi:hypothetical protein
MGHALGLFFRMWQSVKARARLYVGVDPGEVRLGCLLCFADVLQRGDAEQHGIAEQHGMRSHMAYGTWLHGTWLYGTWLLEHPIIHRLVLSRILVDTKFSHTY